MKTISLKPQLPTHRRPINPYGGSTARSKDPKIPLPALDGFLLRRVDTIVHLTAEGNYTRLFYSSGEQELVCKTLRDTEQLLVFYPQFVRVHRSHTVNLDWVERYVRGKGGTLLLENGRSISVSNSRKAALLKRMGDYFGFEQ